MPRLSLNNVAPALPQLASWGVYVALLALTTSRFANSIGMGLILLAAILYGFQTHSWKNLRHPLPWLLGLGFCVTLMGGFQSDLAVWLKDVQEKLPILLLPLAFWILPGLGAKTWKRISWGFVIIMTLIALASIGNYLLHFSSLTWAVKNNSHLPILAKYSHIYFGLYLAWSILLAWDLARHSTGASKRLLLCIAAVDALAIHILTSRTGLLAFYVGILVYALYQWGRGGLKWKYLLLLALGVVLIPVVSYYTIPSFKYRWDATRWDIQQYFVEGKDLSEHSIGQRLIAWETAWEIFQEHPAVGVGMGNIERSMAAKYDERKVRLSPESRLQNPHNQYLEYLVGGGVIGGLFLGISLMVPLVYRRKALTPLLLSFVCMFATALLTESFLERQLGISFYFIFLMLLIKTQSNTLTIDSEIPENQNF